MTEYCELCGKPKKFVTPTENAKRKLGFKSRYVYNCDCIFTNFEKLDDIVDELNNKKKKQQMEFE